MEQDHINRDLRAVLHLGSNQLYMQSTNFSLPILLKLLPNSLDPVEKHALIRSVWSNNLIGTYAVGTWCKISFSPGMVQISEVL